MSTSSCAHLAGTARRCRGDSQALSVSSPPFPLCHVCFPLSGSHVRSFFLGAAKWILEHSRPTAFYGRGSPPIRETIWHRFSMWQPYLYDVSNSPRGGSRGAYRDCLLPPFLYWPFHTYVNVHIYNICNDYPKFIEQKLIIYFWREISMHLLNL